MGDSEARGGYQEIVNWFQPLSLSLIDIYEGEAMFIVVSETHFMVSYEVFINKAGVITCECNDGKYRKKSPFFPDLLAGRNKHSCKHQRAVIKEMQKGNNHE